MISSELQKARSVRFVVETTNRHQHAAAHRRRDEGRLREAVVVHRRERLQADRLIRRAAHLMRGQDETQPTEYCRDLDPTANVVLHQGDIGEYLRVEDGLF